MEENLDNGLRVSTTLSIWNVPLDLAKQFISIAKTKYGNKSWILLQDLMTKAEKYDEYVEARWKKVDELEKRVTELEERLAAIGGSEKEEDEVNTFGGGMSE